MIVNVRSRGQTLAHFLLPNFIRRKWSNHEHPLNSASRPFGLITTDLDRRLPGSRHRKVGAICEAEELGEVSALEAAEFATRETRSAQALADILELDSVLESGLQDCPFGTVTTYQLAALRVPLESYTVANAGIAKPGSSVEKILERHL
ncbi:MAG: hypothetical protein JWO14_1656 [Solirubrobacterales bacterium]|nr:hypothetical protein [Solirubrobacterales bacterium]